MRDAAIDLGLSAEAAHSLSVGTLISAGRLLVETPAPEDLRRRVTSPNGTTAAGLAALASEDRLGALVRATLKAAQERSVELSGS
ncbi:pyrroline-5-carboxylate reductase dimerization domain-containing protein [Roseovarius sp. A-2]|uniref:pyrroline-5-carboxylate reductase dimerization domain-containing protein n=1 Tax=Roseovarius sp. A-2 TaxID=1570360 RepID=UPI00111AB2FA|nr:pyrroline-5-carboxylate reductase dimerization domain-containing protein [Roseovarius sp. A-2]